MAEQLKRLHVSENNSGIQCDSVTNQLNTVKSLLMLIESGNAINDASCARDAIERLNQVLVAYNTHKETKNES